LKSLIIALLLIGAIFCFMHYNKYQSHPTGAQKKTSQKSANSSTAPKEQESAIDSTINYATGHTQIKVLHSTKEKLNKVQAIREQQVKEALGN